jgi:Tol biopolymer transport system component
MQGNGVSYWSSISANGRFVVFVSDATNLVAGDTNGFTDVFVHDRRLGSTERVSIGVNGQNGNGNSYADAISPDGRLVTFTSFASNMVSGDTNARNDVFLRDRQNGTTERVSVGPNGAQGNDTSYGSSLSADGRFVAFTSNASNFFAGDNNTAGDVFLRDRLSGTTELISLATGGQFGNVDSWSPSLTPDGRLVAFVSSATNLVTGDTNAFPDIFVRDRGLGTTERVSISTGGGEGNGVSTLCSISANGRFVSFISAATNLVGGDTNGARDVFLHDRSTGRTELVSVALGGGSGNLQSNGINQVSENGSLVVFTSQASNLVNNDTNGFWDVFLRDGGAIPPGTDVCQAGSGGVLSCPCANPPSGAPRGCDNSAGTGGAQLASSGLASLVLDGVVFSTNGENPTATSIVLQGDTEVTAGAVFGQGVLCVGGSLKRLYVKTASGGSFTAPSAGDPSVSARSAALGDTLTAGMTRWYAVYYRDPIVLGGCPSTSTFNITQTQLVSWLP